MASVLPSLSTTLLLVLLVIPSSFSATDPFDFGPGNQTRLQFFSHATLSGRSPTAVRIVTQSKNSTTALSAFGTITMVDDPLTETSDPSSRLIGRAQGLYAAASQSQADPALLTTLNFAFTDGDYSGSSLAMVGKNPVLSDVRETPVVGGSGAFRMARGYALARAPTSGFSTGDVNTVEYDVYVSHYGRGSGSGGGGGAGGSTGSGGSTTSSGNTAGGDGRRSGGWRLAGASSFIYAVASMCFL